MDSVNGAGARPGSEMEGSRWQCHCAGFDYQGLCMKSIQASAQHVVAGEAHEAK